MACQLLSPKSLAGGSLGSRPSPPTSVKRTARGPAKPSITWLQVPRHTFAAVFGAVIAQGRDYRETFQEFRPGFDLSEEHEKRAAAGYPRQV